VNDALDRLGCGTKLRGDDEIPDRPVEVRPDTNASVLLPDTNASVPSRVLVALAHPTARRPMKPISRSPTTSTTRSPARCARDFVEVYVWNQGQRPGNGETVRIIEQRPQQFREGLGR